MSGSGYLAIRGLCAEGYTSGYAKARLGALRRFLGFVQLRGACPAQLVQAIPSANFRQHYSPGGLTGTQWKKLLRSFDRQTAQGTVSTPALSMIELGLRNCGWSIFGYKTSTGRGMVRVPAMKTGSSPHRPLPATVGDVLRPILNVFVEQPE
jgi:hypothetical protein